MITRIKQFFSGLSRVADGFSLVELVIVVVIVGLSTGIAFPIVASNDTKAKLTEADATLGSLRTQLRIYYTKNGEYPTSPEAMSVIGAKWNDFGAGRMDGKYFIDASYSYVSETGTEFTLICDGGLILDTDRLLNQSGVLSGGI